MVFPLLQREAYPIGCKVAVLSFPLEWVTIPSQLEVTLTLASSGIIVHEAWTDVPLLSLTKKLYR
ncbi:hypothetical protein KDW_07230 [Dictyobacter vulcani]|uniref:Uncharacterized protein n=1 Tax=Dictyobacter vulcani TaxID=2607529 RepID=A0A5J4KK68_9CHLR|nr:hypothetical protein KDW_07230 [Dictyobacter vulcani]